MTCDKSPAPSTTLEKMVEDDRIEIRAIAQALANWAKFVDFPAVATWVRRHLQEQVSFQKWAKLLHGFGVAFRGDEVGHIGRDILTPFLGHEEIRRRQVAIEVLVGWSEYDDDGMWLEIIHDTLDRETDPDLYNVLENALQEYTFEDADDMLTEMLKDCPECNKGHVVTIEGVWTCEECGSAWDTDPNEGTDEDEDPAHFWSDEAELEEPDELEPFRAVQRSTSNNLRALVRVEEIPALLQNVLDLHPLLTLDCIESAKIGHLSVRENNLSMHLSPLHSGDGYLLRGWSETLGYTFSIEPTATEGRWLVFMRWG